MPTKIKAICDIESINMWILAEEACGFTNFFKYYALINRARGPYVQIFVLTFKGYGPNAVKSMRLEGQNKYFPYGPRSRLIRALLYTHINKLIFQ